MAKKERPHSVKLSHDLADRLESEAMRRDVSKSEIIREAVAEYVAGSTEARSGSFLDRAADLCGSLEADPGLSTADLEGYGA